MYLQSTAFIDIPSQFAYGEKGVTDKNVVMIYPL